MLTSMFLNIFVKDSIDVMTAFTNYAYLFNEILTMLWFGDLANHTFNCTTLLGNLSFCIKSYLTPKIIAQIHYSIGLPTICFDITALSLKADGRSSVRTCCTFPGLVPQSGSAT